MKKLWTADALIEVRLARREGKLDRFLNLMRDWWIWEWVCFEWSNLRLGGRSLGHRDPSFDG